MNITRPVLALSIDAAGRLAKRQVAPHAGGADPLLQPAVLSAAYGDENEITSLQGSAPIPYLQMQDLDGNMLINTQSAAGPTFTGLRNEQPVHAYDSLEWDAQNRLAAFKWWNASAGQFQTAATFKYDPEGHLAEEIVPGSGQFRLTVSPHGPGGLSRVLARRDVSGSRVQRYVYGLGLLYEATREQPAAAEDCLYYHFDQVGSTLLITDQAGAAQIRYAYDAYGLLTEAVPQAGAAFAGAGLGESWRQPFGYVGEHGVMRAAVGNLLHMRARFYSPYLRRFINEDPIGFEGGLNWFGYVGGDPLMGMDPTGLDGRYHHVRQPHSIGSFFTESLPDIGIAIYKGVMAIPGEVGAAGRALRQEAQSEVAKLNDPMSVNVGATKWVIGTGLEFFGGASSIVHTPENVVHAAEYHASAAGWRGSFEQSKAVVENYIFSQAMAHPGLAYDALLKGKEVELAGMVGGGVWRSGVIANSLASSFGGSSGRYTPLTLAIGAINIYGGARGEISSLVDYYSQQASGILGVNGSNGKPSS